MCVIHNKQWRNKERNILQYRSRDQWNGCIMPIQLLIINQQHSFLWKEINGTRIIGKKSSMITFVPDMMKRLIKWINVFTLCKSNTVKFYQHASTVWYVIHKSQLFFVKKDFKRVRRKNLLFFKIRISLIMTIKCVYFLTSRKSCEKDLLSKTLYISTFNYHLKI